MAKKNKAILIGEVGEFLSESLFTLKIRKNPRKYIYPIIELNPQVSDMKEFIKPGVLVMIEGKITTTQKEEIHKCPVCSENITDKYIFTTVTPQEIKVIKKSNKSDVFLNHVIILGAVCRDKTFVYTEGTRSPLGNTRYQVAINRGGQTGTDYPWVASYARQAEEDAKRIQKGSQVFIDGILVTRKNIKICVCEKCNTKVEFTEYLSEITAISVEYLNNCIF